MLIVEARKEEMNLRFINNAQPTDPAESRDDALKDLASYCATSVQDVERTLHRNNAPVMSLCASSTTPPDTPYPSFSSDRYTLDDDDDAFKTLFSNQAALEAVTKAHIASRVFTGIGRIYVAYKDEMHSVCWYSNDYTAKGIARLIRRVFSIASDGVITLKDGMGRCVDISPHLERDSLYFIDSIQFRPYDVSVIHDATPSTVPLKKQRVRRSSVEAEKRYRCTSAPDCNREYVAPESLRSHVRRKHTANPPMPDGLPVPLSLPNSPHAQQHQQHYACHVPSITPPTSPRYPPSLMLSSPRADYVQQHIHARHSGEIPLSSMRAQHAMAYTYPQTHSVHHYAPTYHAQIDWRHVGYPTSLGHHVTFANKHPSSEFC